MDESELTGEAEFVKKEAANPILLCGSEVKEGEATMLVVAVGQNTQTGTVFQLFRDEAGSYLCQCLLSRCNEHCVPAVLQGVRKA